MERGDAVGQGRGEGGGAGRGRAYLIQSSSTWSLVSPTTAAVPDGDVKPVLNWANVSSRT